MRRRASAAAVVLTALLAGCGAAGTTPRDAVRDVVLRFGQASAKKDYQEICDRLIARSLSDAVEQFGLPCELAFRRGLASVRRPRLAIRSLSVTGDRARVVVHSTAANQEPSDDLLELRRTDGEWRITALGAAPRPEPKATTARPRATPPGAQPQGR